MFEYYELFFSRIKNQKIPIGKKSWPPSPVLYFMNCWPIRTSIANPPMMPYSGKVTFCLKDLSNYWLSDRLKNG